VVPIRPLLDTRPSSAVVLRPMPTFDELMVLVKKVSRWFERRYGLPAGWSEDDMLQEGAVGLVRAIAKYDPTRPCALETYAGYWVRGSLWRALKERWTELNHEAPPPPDDLEGPWPSPETYCLYRETRDAILDELSLAEQVLVFGAADDEPLSSMARELGLSTSAVFRWHRRALKKVRAAVGARHDDVPPAG
jgi:RNA polymerase sigma factor (sigma-70 family)